MACCDMGAWWRDGTPDLRDWLRRAAIGWRREPVVKKITRPTRLVTARRLGYKAKPGVVMVRVRVLRRGARKRRPTAGRRQKAMGSAEFTTAIALQTGPERSTVSAYPNMTVRETYQLCSYAMSHW